MNLAAEITEAFMLNLDFSQAAIRQVYADFGWPVGILGQGGMALAWQTSRKRAVKVTSDPDDAAWLAHFAGLRMRYIVKVFKVLRHASSRLSAWVVEMELLEKLNPSVRKLVSRIACDLDYNVLVANRGARHANREFQEALDAGSNNREDLDWEDYRQMNEVVRVLKWLAGKRMYFMDLHGAQFGMRPNGEVVLLDLGINPSPPMSKRMDALPNPDPAGGGRRPAPAGGARREKRRKLELNRRFRPHQ